MSLASPSKHLCIFLQKKTGLSTPVYPRAARVRFMFELHMQNHGHVNAMMELGSSSAAMKENHNKSTRKWWGRIKTTFLKIDPLSFVLERGNGQTWLKGHWDQQMTTIMSGLLRSTANTRLAKIQH